MRCLAGSEGSRLLAGALLSALISTIPAASLADGLGGGSRHAGRTMTARQVSAPAGNGHGWARSSQAASLLDWPTFDLDPQRTGATNAATGIGASDVRRLRHVRVALPGTVDSAPIYLHQVQVAMGGTARDVVVVTTTYGRTLAVDATTGAILWRFTPLGFRSWAGTSRITNATPVADPNRQFVYAASPDGRIHKLALATGHEVTGGGWPVRITRDPTHEKLTGSLNLSGGSVIATTGGYLGDAPPYQGHVVLISSQSGAIEHVFNTLCANLHRIITPSRCGATHSAIWGRSGVVVEPGSRNLLFATGNGPYNGRTNFGESLLELTPRATALLHAFTPRSQARLNASDADFGSGSPAVLPGGLVLQGGKDSIMRLYDFAHARRRVTLGGEVQTLPTPGRARMFSAPAVWRHGRQTTVFVATSDVSAYGIITGGGGTAAYALRGRRLSLMWANRTPGTSPVVAGGLLWVYDPQRGQLNVYRPLSARRIAGLPAGPGHWNSPIVVDGHIALPTGNANGHRQQGTLNLYFPRR